MDKLRKRLERNTRNLVELFRERARLAKEIGQFKEEKSMPIRIRQRERELLASIPEMDGISRSIISSLFEFTIVNETGQEENNTNLSGKTIALSGDLEHLQLLAGLAVSSPGVEVYSRESLPEALKVGIQANGAHIVVDDLHEPDLILGLGVEEVCGILIDCRGTLTIGLDCLKSPKPMKILVKQR